MSDVDWSPSGRALALQLDLEPGVTGIAMTSYPGIHTAVVDDSPDNTKGSVTIDDTGSVVWQRLGAASVLVREGRSGPERWNAPDLGYLALDATQDRLIGLRTIAVGEEADVVEVVDVRLTSSAHVEERSIDVRPGAQALSASQDGSVIALATQTRIAGPITFSLVGPQPWSVTIDDAVTAVALLPNAKAIAYVEASTRELRVVGADGKTHSTSAGQYRVSAFDVSAVGVAAVSSANDERQGEVCFFDLRAAS